MDATTIEKEFEQKLPYMQEVHLQNKLNVQTDIIRNISGTFDVFINGKLFSRSLTESEILDSIKKTLKTMPINLVGYSDENLRSELA